jgi:hypothetical protein
MCLSCLCLHMNLYVSFCNYVCMLVSNLHIQMSCGLISVENSDKNRVWLGTNNILLNISSISIVFQTLVTFSVHGLRLDIFLIFLCFSSYLYSAWLLVTLDFILHDNVFMYVTFFYMLYYTWLYFVAYTCIYGRKWMWSGSNGFAWAEHRSWAFLPLQDRAKSVGSGPGYLSQSGRPGTGYVFPTLVPSFLFLKGVLSFLSMRDEYLGN